MRSNAGWIDAYPVSTAGPEWPRCMPRQLHGNLSGCCLRLQDTRICGNAYHFVSMLPLTGDGYGSMPLPTFHRRAIQDNLAALPWA